MDKCFKLAAGILVSGLFFYELFLMPIGIQPGCTTYMDVLRGQYKRNCDFLSNKYVFDLTFDLSVAQGRPLTWTPYVAGGRPLLGDGVSSITDPVHWLVLGLMPKAGFLRRLETEKLAYFGLGLLLILLFARWTKLSSPNALVLALLYFTSEYPTSNHSEYMFFLPAAFSLFSIALWEYRRRTRFPGRLASISLFFAFSWLVALSDFPAILGLTMACWLAASFAVPDPADERRRFQRLFIEVFILAAVLATALALSLPKFLPLAKYLAETTRFNAYHFEATVFNLKTVLREFAGFLPRHLFIAFPAGSFLAALAVVFPASSLMLKRLKVFSLFALTLGFFIHCGALNPLFVVLRWNTRLSQFWPLLTTAQIGLQAVGLSLLWRPPAKGFPLRAAAAAVLGTVPLVPLARISGKPYFFSESAAMTAVLILVLIGSRLAGGRPAGGTSEELSASRPWLPAAGSVILMVMVVMSVSGSGLSKLIKGFPKTGSFYHPLFTNQPVTRFDWPLPASHRNHYLRPEIEDAGIMFRITAFVSDIKEFHYSGPLNPNHGSLWGYLDAGGLYSLFIDRIVRLMVEINGDTIVKSRDGRIHAKEPPLLRRIDPLLRYLSLKYVVSSVELPTSVLGLRRVVEKPVIYDYWINPVQPLKKVFVYEVRDPIPRFFFPTHRLRVPDDRFFAAMRDLASETRPLVLGDSKTAAGEGPQPCPDGEASLVINRGDALTFRLKAEGDTYFVLQDTWMPGWKARLDAEPVAVELANSAFMAVRIPAGDHELEMKYTPPGFKAGLLAAALTLLGLAFGLIVGRGKMML